MVDTIRGLVNRSGTHAERAGGGGDFRSIFAIGGVLFLCVFGESSHVDVCQAQKILEAPVLVCRIPLARFGPYARGVFVGTKIHLSR